MKIRKNKKVTILAGAVTTLAAFLLLTVSHSESGDTPITVGDGSLFIRCRGLNATWNKADGNAMHHPNQRGSVTHVSVTQGAVTQFDGACNSGRGQCMIAIDYGRRAHKGSLRIHSNPNSPIGMHIERTGLADFRKWTETDADTVSFEPNVHDAISVVMINGARFCTGQGNCQVVIMYHPQ